MKRALLIAILIMTLWTLFQMGIDKYAALRGKQRISEKQLLLSGILGGAFGGWIGLYLFQHKTNKAIFHIVYGVGSFLWGVVILLIARSH
ncbi:MAG: DUF1294 domain-containing protein [Aerococcaceae bacterium]|nr:DUF1294 domain-containing protein [Aerococcaceae bacterium]